MRVHDILMLQRDAGGAALVTRCEGQIRALNAEQRTAELTLSSETPVMRWGDQEILSHDAAAIRLQRLREIGAIHLNHDTTQPVAAIKSVAIKDKRLVATVQFGRTALAEDAWKNVQDGVIRGVSVGYRIHKVNIDENARTITAVDWEPYEASLTTIPADPTVGVGRSADQESLWRSLTTNAGKPAQETPVNKLRAILALILAHRHLEAQLLQRSEAITGDTITQTQLDEIRTWAEAQPKPNTTPAPTTTQTTEPGDEKARATQLRLDNTRLTLARQASTFGIQLSDEDLGGIRDEATGSQLLLRKLGEKNKTTPEQPVTGIVVTADATDKRRDAAVDGLLAGTIGVRAVEKDKDLGMRRKSPTEIIRALITDLRDADRDQIARFCTRQLAGLRLRDANQSAADFSTVLGNYADKVVLLGFNRAVRTHTLWTSERLVDDFKDVYGAAVAAGLLEEQTSKGAPAKEMNLTEKSYNAALGLFMRTLKVTYQDWRNDDLGLFADNLLNVGNMAGNTEDWQVYKTLLGLTWTNYVTSTAAFWDDTNDRLKFTGFGNTQSDLESRTLVVGSETIQLNPVLGKVLVPPKRYQAARAVLGLGSVGNGPAAMPVGNVAEPISVPWLANSSLTGYSADDYYCIAGNMDTVKVLRDRLFPGPRVMQLEAGATPDQHFLIVHAFRAKAAAMEGMQKGDWA